MCGICGMIGPGAGQAVRAMTSALHHRGPDDYGVADFGDASLGMARLAVLDLTAAGHQPMFSPDGQVCLVYNGETYNFRELRIFLEKRGHTFTSQCDTEVILRLYLELGSEFVTRLRGMFALAVLDRRGGPGREKLMLARDPFGIKPLLYYHLGAQIVFSSELKSLLVSSAVPREIDPQSLRLLLTYGSVTQPHTMLRGVAMLPPGHTLTLVGSHVRLHRYFHMESSLPEATMLPYPQQVEALRSVLRESVRLQMVGDVPVGAFLSGGLDSALLCALMLESGATRLNTFSVGFEEEGSDLDESEEALATATHLGVNHHHVLVRGQDVAEEISHIARALDQPSVDGVNAYFVSRSARERVTVALSGTGGDELFAGYPWFGHMADWARLQKRGLLRKGRNLLGNALSLPLFDPLAHGPLGHWLEERRSEAEFLGQWAKRHYIFGPTGAARLLAPHLRRPASSGRAMTLDIAHQDELADMSPLCRASALCLRGYTPNQLLRDIDCVSMAHGLEVRVPYLDPHVLGAALSLPEKSKLGPGRPEHYSGGLKRILYDVAQPYLPDNFGARAKRGFCMPFGHWLRGPLKDIFEDTLSPASVASAGLLEPDAVVAVRQAFQTERIMWMKPWLLMMTELWRREVLNAPVETK